MKAAVRTGASARRSSVKKSPLALAIACPFNEAGVVVVPQFVLVRPAGAVGDIKLVVRAHRVDEHHWIAEATWGSDTGHLPFDGRYPSRWNKAFQSRSEAVEDALDRALRRIKAQLAKEATPGAWTSKIEAAAAWVADAVADVRKHDETLPLHGCTVVDLCAGGLGGFGLGLTSLGAEVLLACEIDAGARSVYLQNVKPRRMHDDLCTLDGTKLACDILTLGLLCQAFSNAGKRLGFMDPALAKVYEHTKRLLREIKAKVVVIECARQFLNHDGGKAAEEVRDLLMRAGYRVQHRTLNAAGFGVAQSRERSFIVGTRLGLDVDDILGYAFPEEQAPTAVVEDILDPGIPATIDPSRITLDRPEPSTRSTQRERLGHIDGKTHQGNRVYSPKGVGPALTASGGGAARFSEAFLVGGHARGLTPREASRMQGLPEWAEVHPVMTHAMKHAGNAVAVPVARELGRQLGQIFGKRG
jgi:DNA (cytosine-5)-methyltransferase 1